MVKKFIKDLIPVKVKRFLKKRGNGERIPVYLTPWRGNYTNWELAVQSSTGYNDDIILDKVSTAISKVVKGEAVYERDSVLFDQIQYSWPLLACLFKVAAANRFNLRIADFGGSLGSTYFQNRAFLNPDVHISWHIIEQSKFVEKGKKSFENDQLHFHISLEDCLKSSSIDCLLFSGVLQYLTRPYSIIQTYLKENFQFIIVDRTAFIKSHEERITVQEVPKSIYEASYPCWFFDEAKFLNAFFPNYQLITEFPSFADPDLLLEDGANVYWKGFFLKRKF